MAAVMRASHRKSNHASRRSHASNAGKIGVEESKDEADELIDARGRRPSLREGDSAEGV